MLMKPPPPTRAIVLETSADFWCEAAVLVAVFGILDKMLRSDAVTFVWALKTLGCAIVFLFLGMTLRTWARR